MISLESKEANRVTQQQKDYLQILAQYASVAIAWAGLQAKLQESIKLAEPFALLGKMLSGFLHDVRNRVLAITANIGVMNHWRATEPDREEALF